MHSDKFWKGLVCFSLAFGIGALAGEFVIQDDGVARSQPVRIPLDPVRGSGKPLVLICEKNYRVIPLADMKSVESRSSGTESEPLLIDPPDVRTLFRDIDRIETHDLLYREKCVDVQEKVRRIDEEIRRIEDGRIRRQKTDR